MSINDCIFLLGAYFVGSIPTGYMIASYFYSCDIRQYGSGNIGATNIARVLGKIYFFPVLLIDAAKAYGYLKWLLIYDKPEELVLCAAFGLMLGNTISFFLRGTGGKGIATFLGILAALAPPLFFFSCIIWIIAFLSIRIAGIASAISVLSVSFTALYLPYNLAISIAYMGLWCLYKHKKNIQSAWSSGI